MEKTKTRIFLYEFLSKKKKVDVEEAVRQMLVRVSSVYFFDGIEEVVLTKEKEKYLEQKLNNGAFQSLRDYIDENMIIFKKDSKCYMALLRIPSDFLDNF